MKRTGSVMVFLSMILLATSAYALTADVSIRINGVLPNGLPQVYSGQDNILQIWFTNSAKLKGYSLGLEFQNSGGFPYTIVSPYGNQPQGSEIMQEHGVVNNFLYTFGDGNLNVSFGTPANVLCFGGADASSGQTKNLFAHLTSTLGYSVMVRIPPGEPDGTFCVRPIFVPPAGDWVMDASINIDLITGLPSGATNPDFQGAPTVSSADPGIDWANAACFAREGGSTVGFFAFPTKVDVGMPVFFTGLSTVGVSDWDWDFGDLSTHGTGQNPIHSYSTAGVYTVTLVATLTGGGTQTMVVNDCIQVDPVKADFTASPRYGSLDVNPVLVQFTDASTHTPTNWLWDFGDPASGSQNNSTSQSPTHTYANPGVYMVQLTASNPGSSDTKIYFNCIRVDAVATPDLQVSCYGPSGVRRGFHKNLDIVVTNIGSADAVGTILTLDLSLLPPGVTFAGSVPPPETPPFPAAITWNLPTITWDPTQLQFDDFIVKVDLYIDPAVPVGTDIQTIASVSPPAGEVVLTNNTFTEYETVVASLDPNDKTVQPPGCGSQRAIKGTERLNYLIQFENKAAATADAFYVLVVDTLDPNLDWGTLQLGPSSKDNVLTFDFDPTSGEMVWFFDGYNLPPNVTPPEGEGFVSYSISPKPGLAEGVLIKNRAHIRFDFEGWLAAPEAGPLQLSISNQDLDQDGIIDACEFICGNANGDGIVDISDAVYLIAYIFSGGLAPNPLAAGDANCDGIVDISDAVYLIAYIFSGGLAPCAGCK